MKKCKTCGALQRDDRTTCVDCGSVLGKPMTDAEEETLHSALDDALDGMAERAQDFYVSLPEKIMGILCIIGAAAVLILLNLVGVEKTSLEKQIPEQMMVTYTGNVIITATAIDPETGELSDVELPQRFYSRRSELNNAGTTAFLGLVACIAAAPMLLVPRFVWFIDTLKYRLWYGWDPSPTYFATVMRKIVAHVFFAVGMIGVFYSYFLYFG